MDNPRPDKVAVVNEVRSRLEGTPSAILTEYRGLTVAELAELRRALAAVGGDYKIYKNTLVKLAVAGGSHEALADLLVGPTAIAFVSGEVTAVAKALRDYARSNPHLVIKGGMQPEGFLSPEDLAVLADLPSRDVLLSRVAGGIAAPLQQMAGLLQAPMRNFAYGLSALLDQQGGVPAPAEPEPTEPEAAAPAGSEPAAPAGSEPATAEAAAPAEGDKDDVATETSLAEGPPAESAAEAEPAAPVAAEAEAEPEPAVPVEAEPEAEAEAESEA